jgi:ATP-dependent Clp protease ATP-binding subunit ClpC
MFDRMTDRARTIFALAEEFAVECSHDAVHSGHVVVGCAHEGSGLAAHVLKNCEVKIDALSRRVASQPLSASAANDDMVALEAASRHTAHILKHQYCGTEHLLMGICLVPTSAGASALVDVGASPSELGQEVLDILGHFDLHWQSVIDAFL